MMEQSIWGTQRIVIFRHTFRSPPQFSVIVLKPHEVSNKISIIRMAFAL